MHAGEVDVLVGTQMVAKGHDFRRITLVAAVQPDGALFSSDFRAPERLFCLLMQAAGRAGRDAGYVSDQGSQPEMWVQTAEPQHSVFAALRQHDYPAFAARQLQERHDAGMPPFAFQALVRADAKTQDAAQAFLSGAIVDAQARLNIRTLVDSDSLNLKAARQFERLFERLGLPGAEPGAVAPHQVAAVERDLALTVLAEVDG